MKTTIAFILTLLLSCHMYSQGLHNAGARIVFTGAAQIYIDGATGNYSNTASGLITPSATSSITLLGNWINNGGNAAFVATDGGGVVFAGAAQNIGGSSATGFNNVSLTGSGTKQLTVTSNTVGGQTTFAGVLSLGTRPLNLNSNTLVITNPAIAAITNSGGYIISETALAANPSIVRWYHRTVAGSKVYPFGTVGGTSIPFTFNITAAMAAGSFVDASTRPTAADTNQPWANTGTNGNVTTMNSPNGVFADGSEEVVIDRWWEITPSSAVTANVIFTYLGSENTLLPAYNTGLIGPQRWGGSQWVGDNFILSAGTNGVLAGTGTGFANGLTAFGHMVLSSQISPLPVELLNFDAVCNNNKVKLNWCTASEKNNDYFTVEQSTDGIEFFNLGNVTGNGTTGSKHCYSFDASTLTNGINYFRLKQIDNDGITTTSKIISLKGCETTKDNIVITNEGTKEIGVLINSTSNQKLSLRVYNSLGQIVSETDLTAVEGYNALSVNVANLANAVYYVAVFKGEENVSSKKIVVSDLTK